MTVQTRTKSRAKEKPDKTVWPYRFGDYRLGSRRTYIGSFHEATVINLYQNASVAQVILQNDSQSSPGSMQASWNLTISDYDGEFGIETADRVWDKESQSCQYRPTRTFNFFGLSHACYTDYLLKDLMRHGMLDLALRHCAARDLLNWYEGGFVSGFAQGVVGKFDPRYLADKFRLKAILEDVTKIPNEVNAMAWKAWSLA